jgi:4-hydroxy-3-polyprenylbenzoate decarboxylase
VTEGMYQPVGQFRLVVAMTGATGAIYGVRILETLRDTPVETHAIISAWAEKTIAAETGWNATTVMELADYLYDENNQAARLSSGSFLTGGMIVAPCSMKSLSAIANGFSDNLISRAADVTLKEGRKLLLLVRESPLNAIHLENMLRLARLGVVIMPPAPAFYARPRTLEEMVDHTVGRALDHFGVELNLVRRWGERRASRGNRDLVMDRGDFPEEAT